MGNCQTVDAAALVIQHPCGKLERMYWPLTASDVMKTNPGHYVSLIIPLPPLPPTAAADHSDDNRTVRFTRVKLLRPTDTLVLGRAYRLVTTQGLFLITYLCLLINFSRSFVFVFAEVVKVLRAKKHAKMKRNVAEPSSQKQSTSSESEVETNDQVIIFLFPHSLTFSQNCRIS